APTPPMALFQPAMVPGDRTSSPLACVTTPPARATIPATKDPHTARGRHSAHERHFAATPFATRSFADRPESTHQPAYAPRRKLPPRAMLRPAQQTASARLVPPAPTSPTRRSQTPSTNPTLPEHAC